MIEILFIFLPLAMLRVKDGDRVAAIAFTIPTLIFYFINLAIPDWLYYLIAAFYDALIIAILLFSQSKRNTRLVKVLSSMCFVAIVVQFIGFGICVTGGNGSIYNAAAIMFYVIVIAIFLTWNKLDGILSRYISDRPWFFHSVFLRHKVNN